MNPKIEQITRQNAPQHIAIIMDGNGRWAQQRSQERTLGHMAGIEAVRRVIKTSIAVGVEYLTLYTFSQDNWARPQQEVEALMSLLIKGLEQELPQLIEQGVRLRTIGNLLNLPPKVQSQLASVVEQTSLNERITLVLALSYSAKDEILNACKQAMDKSAQEGLSSKDWTEKEFAKLLYTHDMPEPDLLIRTGGEYRLSNFLLWQCAYTELYFCKTYWPDFGEDELCTAIIDYQQRQRRYGKTGEQISSQNQKCNSDLIV